MGFKFRPAAMAAVIVIAIGCQATASPSNPPSPSQPSATTSAPSAGDSVLPSANVMSDLPGRIAFARGEFPAPEHYFTIRPDGSEERNLFSIEGCSCLQFSPDGQTIWTQSVTEQGTLAFATIKDGEADRTVVVPSPKTLSLAAGPHASTPDGALIAFYGWDDTDPKAEGLYLAAPDLSDLRQVIGIPNGFEWITPYGVTPDGAKVIFFAERGAVGGVTHTGDLFLVDATGDNLRKLNPDGWLLAEVAGRPASLSPDGVRVSFAAGAIKGGLATGALFVVALEGGEAKRVAEAADWLFSAAWAPRGERILFGNVIVNADGTDRRDVSSAGEEVGSIAWSPEGTHLIATRGPQRSRDLWVMDLDGNFLNQVTHDPGTYGVWDWR